MHISQHNWTELVSRSVCILPLQNATVALGPLVITPDRYEVIDFTQSFDVARLTAAVRHDPARRRSSFGGPLAFVRPLSGSVWTLLGVVFVATTILLYAVDRLDPPPPSAAELATGGIPTSALARRLSLGQSAVCALTTMMLMTRSSPPPTTSSTLDSSEINDFALPEVTTSVFTASLAFHYSSVFHLRHFHILLKMLMTRPSPPTTSSTFHPRSATSSNCVKSITRSHHEWTQY